MAQRIEHRTSNPTVAGSSPAGRASDLTGRRRCLTSPAFSFLIDEPQVRLRCASVDPVSESPHFGRCRFRLKGEQRIFRSSRQINVVNLEVEIATNTVTLQVKPQIDRATHSFRLRARECAARKCPKSKDIMDGKQRIDGAFCMVCHQLVTTVVTTNKKARTEKALAWGFSGAGDGNRTRVRSLEGFSSTIEPHPQLVGTTGFEPATSCSQSRRATRLRHVPTSKQPG